MKGVADIYFRGVSEANQPVTSEGHQTLVKRAENFLVDRRTGLLRLPGAWTADGMEGGGMGGTNEFSTKGTDTSVLHAETMFSKSAVYYSRIMIADHYPYSWVSTGDASDSWGSYDGTIRRAYQYSTGTVSTNTTSTDVTLAGGGHWITPATFQVGDTSSRRNYCYIVITGAGGYRVTEITDDLSLTIASNATATVTGANYTLYVGHSPYPQPKIETYGYYKLYGGYFAENEVNYSYVGSFIWVLPTDGKRVTGNASPISAIYTAPDFTVVDGYVIIVGGATHSNTTATPPAPAEVQNFFRIRWTSPGTYDDFTSSGSGYMDATQIGALRTCNAVNHNVVIGGTYGVGILQTTGDFDYPFSWTVVSSSIAPATPMVRLNDAIFFVGRDGWLYSSDGINVNRFLEHYNFGQEPVTTSGTYAPMPYYITPDHAQNRLYIWGSASTTDGTTTITFVKVVDCASRAVTTLKVPGTPFFIQGNPVRGRADGVQESGDFGIFYNNTTAPYYINDYASGSGTQDGYIDTKEVDLGGSSDNQRSIKQARLRFDNGEYAAYASVMLKDSDISSGSYNQEDIWHNSGSLDRFPVGTIGTSTHYTIAKADASKIYGTGYSLIVFDTARNWYHRASSWVTSDPTNYTCTLTPTPNVTGVGTLHLLKTCAAVGLQTFRSLDAGETVFGFNNVVDRPSFRIYIYQSVPTKFFPTKLTIIYDDLGNRKLNP